MNKEYESIETSMMTLESSLFFDNPDFISTAEDYEYVVEGYQGKTKECLAIEKLCQGLIDDFGHNDDFISISTSKIKDDKRLNQIAKELEKLFGFKEARVTVLNRAVPNAFTIPAGPVWSMIFNSGMPQSPPVGHGAAGRYYDSHHDYFCYISIHASLFSMLTAEEITAIIIHEVGHNFDVTMSTFIFDIIFKGIMLRYNPINAIFDRYLAMAHTEIMNALDYTYIIPLILNGIYKLNEFSSMILGPLAINTALIRIINGIANDPYLVIFGGGRFQSEAFADNFATSYGYGPATISAFDKFDKIGVVTDKGKLAELWTGTGSAAVASLIWMIDPHPHNQTRCKMILDDMEELMKDKNLSPAMRKIVAADYERTKIAYEKFLDAGAAEDRAHVTSFFRNLRENWFGGRTDPRLLLYKLANPRKATKFS